MRWTVITGEDFGDSISSSFAFLRVMIFPLMVLVLLLFAFLWLVTFVVSCRCCRGNRRWIRCRSWNWIRGRCWSWIRGWCWCWIRGRCWCWCWCWIRGRSWCWCWIRGRTWCWIRGRGWWWRGLWRRRWSGHWRRFWGGHWCGYWTRLQQKSRLTILTARWRKEFLKVKVAIDFKADFTELNIAYV